MINTEDTYICVKAVEVGTRVHYQPKHYGKDKWENGIIKEIPKHATESQMHSVRVVYNCGDDWDNYMNYTSALTHKRDLFLVWKEVDESAQDTKEDNDPYEDYYEHW